MPETKTVFAVGGENLIDHVTNEGQVSAKVGGSPFNVAIGLGRQEAKVSYVSPISTDPWGGKLAAALETSSVRLTGGRLNLPTTMARVMVKQGIPSYRFEREGTAERQITIDGLKALLFDAEVIHTGSLTLTDGQDADDWALVLKWAYDAGKFVSFDPNVRLSVVSDPDAYRSRIANVLKAITFLKLSDEDLESLFPKVSFDDAIQGLLDNTSAALVVVTRGPEGAIALLNGRRIEIDAAPVSQLVDAVGAGDTFTATMLAGLERQGRLSVAQLNAMCQDDLTQLLTQASQAAAINCGREGCDPPTWTELQESL
ncbi:MAG: carbohydrate kinase family protein [Planktomarina sp.]